jgi:hypothetical protein
LAWCALEYWASDVVDICAFWSACESSWKWFILSPYPWIVSLAVVILARIRFVWGLMLLPCGVTLIGTVVLSFSLILSALGNGLLVAIAALGNGFLDLGSLLFHPLSLIVACVDFLPSTTHVLHSALVFCGHHAFHTAFPLLLIIQFFVSSVAFLDVLSRVLSAPTVSECRSLIAARIWWCIAFPVALCERWLLLCIVRDESLRQSWLLSLVLLPSGTRAFFHTLRLCSWIMAVAAAEREILSLGDPVPFLSTVVLSDSSLTVRNSHSLSQSPPAEHVRRPRHFNNVELDRFCRWILHEAKHARSKGRQLMRVFFAVVLPLVAGEWCFARAPADASWLVLCWDGVLQLICSLPKPLEGPVKWWFQVEMLAGTGGLLAFSLVVLKRILWLSNPTVPNSTAVFAPVSFLRRHVYFLLHTALMWLLSCLYAINIWQRYALVVWQAVFIGTFQVVWLVASVVE